MENKKIKVKLFVGYKRYRTIEVDKSEVEKIRAINRLTWRDLKKEERQKESMEKENIVIESLEDVEKECENVPDLTAVNPLAKLVEEDEEREKYAPLYNAILQLTERQQQLVKMVYFNEMSQDEVAEYFGVTKSSISNAMQRIYATLKKFLENF